MRWHNRYELMEPIAAGSKSSRAREKNSETPLLLHPLSGAEQPSLAKVLQRLDTPGAREHAWDIWESGGALYLVTDTHFGEVELEDWLQRAGEVKQNGTAGEFTRVFQTSQSPATAPRLQTDPGEFTRLFQASPPSAPPVTAPMRKAEAGEFTRFLAAPTSQEQVEAPMQSALGELTALFQRPAQRPVRPAPVSPAPAAILPPLPAPAREIGDFTRLLGPTFPSMPDVKPQATAATRPASAPTPGEYTSLISVQRPPKPVPEETAASAPPAVAGRRGLAPVLIFSTLAVLALVLTLVVALWR